MRIFRPRCKFIPICVSNSFIFECSISYYFLQTQHMKLHDLCIDILNHQIPQALACGKALKQSNSKDLILTFGSLHFFVVSGAHLNFVQHYLQRLKTPRCIEMITLALFVITCDFSAPITRSYIQHTLKLKRHFLFPKELLPLIAYTLCFPLFLYSGHTISLGLSFLFSSVISLSVNSRTTTLLIYAIALPVFLATLGLPHYSSIFLLPFVTAFISLLLPLSFLSLLSNSIEITTVKLWWFFEDSLKFLYSFYNYPLKPISSFHSLTSLNLFLYGFAVTLFSYLIGVLWKRSSYSFSSL